MPVYNHYHRALTDDWALAQFRGRAARLRTSWDETCDKASLVVTDGSPWRSRLFRTEAIEAGWKIHVSANLLNAPQVLERCIEVLDSCGINFKVARDLHAVQQLNAGVRTPFSQVGKLVTAYPGRSQNTAIKLANLLAETVGPQPHPPVPSDRQWTENRPIYYRWGAYTGDEVESPEGRIKDSRLRSDAVPPWVRDLQLASPEHKPDLRDTPYRIVQMRMQRGKGAVFEGFDLESVRQVFVKQGLKNGEQDFLGRDGYSRVQHERTVLGDLARQGVRAPLLIDLIETSTAIYLVTELVAGVPLDMILRHQDYSIGPDAPRLALAAKFDELMDCVHAAGWIWGDVKPQNLLLTRDGQLVATDFEGACRPGGLAVPWSSPGYTSPSLRGVDVARASFEWDIYGAETTTQHIVHPELMPRSDLAH